MTGQFRAFSFGGGVQSTAALVLAARGEIDFKTFVFANTGDDSESPHTIKYIAEHSRPFAEANGIEFVEVQWRLRNGQPDTLLQRIHRRQRSVVIPASINGGAPAMRTCTFDFKIKTIGKFLKARGATVEQPAQVGIGFSIDEFQRMRTKSTIPWEVMEYPLIDLRLSRRDCLDIIDSAGLPPAPKSSCWFCPYHAADVWRDMATNDPDLFQQSVELEQLLDRRMRAIGNNGARLSHKTLYLRELIGSTDSEAAAMCNVGNCMT